MRQINKDFPKKNLYTCIAIDYYTFALLQQFFSLPSPKYTSPMIPHIPHTVADKSLSVIISNAQKPL